MPGIKYTEICKDPYTKYYTDPAWSIMTTSNAELVLVLVWGMRRIQSGWIEAGRVMYSHTHCHCSALLCRCRADNWQQPLQATSWENIRWGKWDISTWHVFSFWGIFIYLCCPVQWTGLVFLAVRHILHQICRNFRYF